MKYMGVHDKLVVGCGGQICGLPRPCPGLPRAALVPLSHQPQSQPYHQVHMPLSSSTIDQHPCLAQGQLPGHFFKISCVSH